MKRCTPPKRRDETTQCLQRLLNVVLSLVFIICSNLRHGGDLTKYGPRYHCYKDCIFSNGVLYPAESQAQLVACVSTAKYCH